MISSTIRQFWPSTSPITFMTSATFACFPAFVDNRQRRVVQTLGDRPGPLHTPGVRRNHREIRNVLRLEIIDGHRAKKQMVHRLVEKSLNLRRMQIQST